MDLRGANVSGANLEGAVLEEVDLRGANLSGVNLQGARGSVDLRGANLRDANLSGAQLGPMMWMMMRGWRPFLPESWGTILCNTTMSDGSVRNDQC